MHRWGAYPAGGRPFAIASALGKRRPAGGIETAPITAAGASQSDLRQDHPRSGPNHRQNDNDRGSDAGDFVEQPELLFGERTLALLQLLEIADHPAVVT